MSRSLLNKRILVTRPKHQAKQLCDLISVNKGEAISFPSIEIKTADEIDNKIAHSETLARYNFIIFVSRNAVKAAFEQNENLAVCSEGLQFVAIGAGTAEALADVGILNVLHAGQQADSEKLLQLAEFQTERLIGKKALIVRGVGGREYLKDNLSERGALVDYAEVYERCLPKYDANVAHNIWQNIKPDAVVVSSHDGLKNLVCLTAESDREQLFNTPLVLMSDRSISLAKELGFISGTVAAVDKNDHGLLLALLGLVGE